MFSWGRYEDLGTLCNMAGCGSLTCAWFLTHNLHIHPVDELALQRGKDQTANCLPPLDG